MASFLPLLFPYSNHWNWARSKFWTVNDCESFFIGMQEKKSIRMNYMHEPNASKSPRNRYRVKECQIFDEQWKVIELVIILHAEADKENMRMSVKMCINEHKNKNTWMWSFHIMGLWVSVWISLILIHDIYVNPRWKTVMATHWIMYGPTA